LLSATILFCACGSTSTESVAGPAPEKCEVAVTAPAASLAAGGGAGSINVATQPECTWTAAAEAAWLSQLSPDHGQGSARIDFRAAPNPNNTARESAIVVNGIRATVRQVAAECQFVASSTGTQFSAAGGTGIITFSAPAGCTWVVSVSHSWIAVSPPSGTGAAAVTFSVAPNTGGPRSGTVAIGGVVFTLNQAGAATSPPSPSCTVALQPASASTTAAGGTGEVSITTAAGCGWTTSIGAPWIAITTAPGGNGSGSFGYSVAANTTPTARTGTITVSGQTFTVSQAGLCTFAIKPSSRNFDEDGGTHSVSVTAPSTCAWTATSNADFITITDGQSGSGNGTVTYRVAEYKGKGTRTGTLTIAGETFTVTQKD
jgi:hypothetical protein